MTAAVALVCGGIIWNLVFDLWLGQVERQYLYEQARHELGLGPSVSLKVMTTQAAHDGAWIATGSMRYSDCGTAAVRAWTTNESTK